MCKQWIFHQTSSFYADLMKTSREKLKDLLAVSGVYSRAQLSEIRVKNRFTSAKKGQQSCGWSAWEALNRLCSTL